MNAAWRTSKAVPATCRQCCREMPLVLACVVKFCARSQGPLHQERMCFRFTWDGGTKRVAVQQGEVWDLFGVLEELEPRGTLW